MQRKQPISKTNPKNLKKQISAIKIPNSEMFFSQISFIIFLFGLSLIYIFNTHHANRSRMNTMKLQEEIKYLRGEHTALKAQSVDLFRHSVLLEEVKKLDLTYSDEPLKIISYEKEEL